jgi:xylulokinase
VAKGSLTGQAFLGLDLGTSACKALLVGEDGRVLAVAEERLELLAERPLQAEQDAEAWWRATVRAVRMCIEQAAGVRIQAVGLTGQKHALLPLDEEHRPLRPALLWADGRAHAEADELRAVFPAIARRTGSLPQPGFLVPKWLRYTRGEPELRARTRRICFAKDWIRLRLTDTFATDRTEASAAQAYDFRKDSWAEPLLMLFELPREVLAPVVRSTTRAGRISAEAAEATGLEEGTPVAAGAGDNEAAALGCGALGDGRVAVILGTSGTVVGWSKQRTTAGGLSWNRHVLPTGYAATGTVLSAGRSLRWIRRAAFPRDFTVPQVLEAAEASDPSRAPLVYLPGLVGERSPVPDAHATGCFVGLRPLHGRGHLARAVVDGVSLGLAEILVLMRGAGVQVRALHVTSGGAASDLWRRTIAAAAGVPVRRVAMREGPALGAAMLAAAMTRQHGSLEDLVERWVEPGPEEEGDADEATRLERLGASARAVRNALRGVL